LVEVSSLMRSLLLPLLIICGPAIASTIALLRAVKEYRSGKLRAFPLCAVAGAWLITAYAPYVFLRHVMKSSPYLPPWEDPETLHLAMLLFLAPVGLGATAVAGLCGASRWVILPLAASLLLLFLVGCLEAASV
jgi:hypothetical protein